MRNKSNSSQPGAPQEEKWKHTLTEEDKGIDFSDIPPLDLEKLAHGERGKFFRPIKEAISIRLDKDVLDWFRNQEGKYQQRINQVLRAHMEASRKP